MHDGSLLRDLPDATRREVLQTLARSAHVRVERIVSHGQRSAPGFWYDQPEHEWVLVVEGSAELEVDGRGSLTLAPGDWVDIPAHVRHRVVRTADDRPTIWLAVFYT